MIKIINIILMLIFPPKCIFCGKILNKDFDTYVCEDCSVGITFLENGIVRNNLISNNDKGCSYIVCVCKYSGIIKDAIKRFKFHGKPGYYRTFGALMADRLEKMTNVNDFDIITCVPLHKRRESMRGYNQSLLLAKELGERLGIPVKPRLLFRQKNTQSQSILGKKERLRNVSGAFKATGMDIAKGKTILLVDDIMTTGITIEECSRVLMEAGAKKVIGAVIATGRGM